MRASFAGFVSHGPQLHFWCLLLDRYVSFGGTSWGLVAKIALDQTFFASYMNAAFCFIVELLQGRSLGDVVKKVGSTQPSCVKCQILAYAEHGCVHESSKQSLPPCRYGSHGGRA
mmetsp:Transcript_5779/g.10109  ORF Transcript_5779/g.10109 Transcript_5779/m.10109 type:complete len:115 (+) Transcript_5779:142-486(+)